MKYWCIPWVQPFSLPGIFGSKRAALLKNLAEHYTVPCFPQMTPMKLQRGRRSSQDTHSEECNWCCEGPAMQNWSNHKHLSSARCRVQHTTYSIYKNCKSMHKYNKKQCWHLVCKVPWWFWHLLPSLEGRCELIFTLTTSGIALHLNLLPIIFQKVSVAD